jgi:release factor glutamine methyltransferase
MPTNHKPHEPAALGTLLKWGEKELAAAGLPDAELDAAILLAHLLKTERAKLYLEFNREIPAETAADYESFIARRIAHEPVAYITGFKEFYSLPFHVDSNVLIPRPETEYLVEEILAKVEEAGNVPQTLLDLCTGSGCIAVACARFSQQLKILATDINYAALELAKENARLNGFNPSPHSRIEFILSDLFKDIPASHQEPGFDYIVSNPPYIRHAEVASLMPDVRDYEPVLALDGGKEGTGILQLIIDQSPYWLKPGGWLMLEIGYDQGAVIKNKLEQSGAYTLESIEIKKDFSNLDRMAIARKKGIKR